MTSELADAASALAIYAHPDDAETSAGGALARLAEQGARVCVVVCAQGDKGSADTASNPSALVEVRRREALAAGSVLGVTETTFLEIPDGAIDGRDQTFVRELVRVIRQTKPDIVFGPDPTAVFFGDTYINHRDHREVGWALLDAVAAAANPHYFPEQLQAGLQVHSVRELLLSGTLEPNTSIDIAEVLHRKIDAIFEHRSQLVDADDTFREFLTERAREAGRSGGLGAAEAFRRVRLQG